MGGGRLRSHCACVRPLVRQALDVPGFPEHRRARVAAVAVGLIACTSVTSGSTRDDEAPFERYRTFAVAAPPERVDSLPGYDREIGEIVRSELTAGLRRAGLESAASDRAELEVSFQLGAIGGFSVSGNSFGGNVHVAPYIEGHLSVAIFERRSERMVWHGWAALKEYRQGQEAEHARLAARAVVDRFPDGEAGGDR